MTDNTKTAEAQKDPRCRRCKGELQYLAAIPKRVDASACEIYRCTQCAEVQWIERAEKSR